MPRYFFHYRDGRDLDDKLGLEFSSDAEAHTEAIRGARSIMADTVKKGRLPLSATIAVDDEQGKPLFRLTFEEAVTIT